MSNKFKFHDALQKGGEKNMTKKQYDYCKIDLKKILEENNKIIQRISKVLKKNIQHLTYPQQKA